jgi:hypothetical protein
MAKPERRSDESPVDYYKRTRCCPDDFMEPHKGKWFCNPAHCHHEFDTEEARDKHLRWAYALLD